MSDDGEQGGEAPADDQQAEAAAAAEKEREEAEAAAAAQKEREEAEAAAAKEREEAEAAAAAEKEREEAEAAAAAAKEREEAEAAAAKEREEAETAAAADKEREEAEAVAAKEREEAEAAAAADKEREQAAAAPAPEPEQTEAAAAEPAKEVAQDRPAEKPAWADAVAPTVPTERISDQPSMTAGHGHGISEEQWRIARERTFADLNALVDSPLSTMAYLITVARDADEEAQHAAIQAGAAAWGIVVGVAGAAHGYAVNKALSEIVPYRVTTSEPLHTIWQRTPWKRGTQYEGELVERVGGGLPPNFKTIDTAVFVELDGEESVRVISSIKTMNVRGRSYQTSNEIFSKLRDYLDLVADFTQYTLSDVTVTADASTARFLHIVLQPELTTEQQRAGLERAYEHAKKVGVGLWIWPGPPLPSDEE